MKIDTIQYIRSHFCLKKVWLNSVKKKIKAELSFELNLVSKEKKILFKLIKDKYNGIECGTLSKTRSNLDKTILNGKFSSKKNGLNCTIFTEILKKNKDGSFNLIEITNQQKISTSFKKGVEYKLWVLEQNNIKIRHIYIYKLNGNYTCRNKKILKKIKVNINTKDVPAQLDKISRINTRIEPQMSIGDHCTDIVECPFYSYCTEGITPCSTVYLDENENVKFKYIKDIKNITLNAKQKLQRKAAHSHELEINKDDLNLFMGRCTDFSFLNLNYYTTCIPKYGINPGQDIFYQASILNNELTSFIEGDKNPHFNLLRFILKNTKDYTKVLVWDNVNIFNFLDSLNYPKYKDRIQQLKDKIIEFKPLFEYTVYHENFRNSLDLKYISPVFSENDFERLYISSKENIAALHQESKSFDTTKKYNTRKLLQNYYDLTVIAMSAIFEKLKDYK